MVSQSNTVALRKGADGKRIGIFDWELVLCSPTVKSRIIEPCAMSLELPPLVIHVARFAIA